MKRLALALLFGSFTLSGCGSASMPAAEVSREETIVRLEEALATGNPELIDELVDFEVIRADLKALFVEMLHEDAVTRETLKQPGKEAEFEALIDKMLLENVSPQGVADVVLGISPSKDGFPSISEGWSIRPIDETTFVAQHPDRSEGGNGTIGLRFELRGDRYVATGVQAGDKSLTDVLREKAIFPGQR